jgi:hypothetical protein
VIRPDPPGARRRPVPALPVRAGVHPEAGDEPGRGEPVGDQFVHLNRGQLTADVLGEGRGVTVPVESTGEPVEQARDLHDLPVGAGKEETWLAVSRSVIGTEHFDAVGQPRPRHFLTSWPGFANETADGAGRCDDLPAPSAG